jgi:two-component system OmpR family response regulator
MKLLLVEDDDLLSDGIAGALKQSGYNVDISQNGEHADLVLRTSQYDMVLLDLGLPGLDGLEVLSRLRKRGERIPVLLLTARDGDADLVKGLDLGADDYITKPFLLPVLEARVRALLRRSQWDNKQEVSFGPLSWDVSTRTALLHGAPMDLSGREQALVELLLRRPGKTVSKDLMIDQLSSWEKDMSANALEVIVHRVRKKLEPGGLTIKSFRGLGYMLREIE